MSKLVKQAMFLLLAVALFAPPALRAEPYQNNKDGGNPRGGKFAKKHPRRNEVNKRVAKQRGRINRDVKDGKLTKAQARQLRQNDNAIKAQEHADVKANGGTLTKGEQRQFNQEENANSKMIHDEAHPAGQ